MTIHLFYHVKTKLKRGYIYDTDETVENAMETDITEMLKLFKEPYTYECRIDFSSGESFFIKRSRADVENGVFTVTYSRAWNSHDEPVQMTGKSLKKKLLETENRAV